MCALVLGCHKYGLDPGEQTPPTTTLASKIYLCNLRQYRPSDRIVLGRPRHTLSPCGGLIPLHQLPEHTFRPRDNHRRNFRRCGLLGRPHQQKPTCKISPSGRLVAAFWGYDHQQRHRGGFGSVC